MSISGRRPRAEPSPRLRINLSVLPSATTGRTFLLIMAVIGTSLFTYDFMYLAFGPVSSGRQDTVWMLGGVAALLLVTAAFYLAMPSWIMKRRSLAPLTYEDSPELLDEVAQLVRAAGLPRPPTIVVDALNPSVSALVFGLPTRRYIRLNAGLTTLFFTDTGAFRATVRHELAHLRNRDVDQTYVTTAVWYAFLVTALTPLIVTMVSQPGLDLIGASWRALALTLTVLLFRNAVLRSREYSADAQASQWDGPNGSLLQVLGASATVSATRHRWPFSTHPAATSRQAAINNPAALYRSGFWDAVGIGLACTIAFSSVILLLRSVLGQSDPVVVRFTAALFFAPLAAAGLTASIWRAVLHARCAGLRQPSALITGVGLSCGVVLGEPLSLPASITGMWGPGPAPEPSVVMVGIAALVVTSVLLAGWIRTCGLAWARVVPTRPRVVVAVAIAASTLVLTPLLSHWTLLRDLHPLVPTLSRQAAQDYAALSLDGNAGPFWLWFALEHPLLLQLVDLNSSLAAAVVLCLFPVAGLMCSYSLLAGGAEPSSPGTPKLLLTVVLFGLAGGVAYIALIQTLLGPLGAPVATDFGLSAVLDHWKVAGAVIMQAVIALGVVLSTPSFRISWGLLAASVTGAVSAISATVPNSCTNCWTPSDELDLGAFRQILVEGSGAAVLTGLLGLAAIRVAHRIQTTARNTPPRP